MASPPLPRPLVADGGLAARWQAQPSWTVLDTAFATLGNFFRCRHTWQQAPLRPRVLHYVGLLEAHQLDGLPDLAQALCESESAWRPLWADIAPQLKGLSAGQHRLLLQNGALSLTLCVGPLATLLGEQQLFADTVYLGHAEAPLDTWQLKALARCCRRGARIVAANANCLSPGAMAETGFVDLETTGGLAFTVFNPHWRTEARDALSAITPPTRCIVVGAGLAGASVAQALALRGWQVTVLDRQPQAAHGASGLPVGLVVPHRSADDSPRSRLSRVGAHLTLQHARKHLQAGQDWYASGVQEMDVPAQTSHWHADAAWIRPAQLVQAWLKHPNIGCRFGTAVAQLERGQQVWLLKDAQGQLLAEAEQVVFANATASVPLLLAPPHLAYLGEGVAERLATLHAVHGTVSYAPHQAPPPAHWPTPPVNGHGYFVPQVPLNGALSWLVGSTFEPDRIPEQPCHALMPLDDQHRANAQRLSTLLPAVGMDVNHAFADLSVSHWSSTRCVSHDRLPLVGPLDDGPSPSLWLHTALGARGLSFSALGAELLAARLGAEPWPVQTSLARSLDLRRPKRKRG
ncbi:MAG: FAD-dependent oxidoreductase [Rhodoferax sp.]|nr:FAD-dependent oxidoreductase [Rhodoferax sp.]